MREKDFMKRLSGSFNGAISMPDRRRMPPVESGCWEIVKLIYVPKTCSSLVPGNVLPMGQCTYYLLGHVSKPGISQV